MDANAQENLMTRHAMVCAVLARVAAGMTLSVAIGEVTQLRFPSGNGREVRRQRRTLYRWVAAFRQEGFEGLRRKESTTPQVSRALSEEFLSFLKTTKEADGRVSIPEIIRIAVEKGIVKPGEVSRVSAWRAAQRLNLVLLGVQGKESAPQKRRFAYAHRMQMVLCDGKHFRAGVSAAKRLVFTFIDDATRKVLIGVVGTDETQLLFLRGLHRLVLRYGKPICLYVDNGAGFIGNDTKVVCARLGIHLIHGTAGYPEGHGKIERFNRTQWQGLLRSFAGNPEIDADFTSLENRIEHYYERFYNLIPHESLAPDSPADRWTADKLPLMPVDDRASFEKHFVISKRRRVSEDNIVKIDGDNYEIPSGYAGTIVLVEEDYLHGFHHVLHEGRRVRLHEVRLAENAHTQRKGTKPNTKPPLKPVITAANVAYRRDFEPVVNATGDFPEPNSLKKE